MFEWDFSNVVTEYFPTGKYTPFTTVKEARHHKGHLISERK